MRQRSRIIESNEELNIWPAFTDLMSNAFMIIVLFFLLAVIMPVASQIALDKNSIKISNKKDKVVELNRQIIVLQSKLNRIEQTEQEVKALQKQLKLTQKAIDAPPILVIEDQGSYRFASGSAEVPRSMDDYIRDRIVPEIESNTNKYQINVVEIIGHTDGQVNGSGNSNLDLNLEKVASVQESVRNLSSGSNTDLGLMRALAVVRVLRDIQTHSGRLRGLKFRPYSAAQLILPNGEFAPINRSPDATRRRIEIRFTRPGKPIKVT